MSRERFSEFLGELIRQSGLSKTLLAQRAGISRASLYNLLNGDVAESKLSTLMRVSSALGVHPLDIPGWRMAGVARSQSSRLHSYPALRHGLF